MTMSASENNIQCPACKGELKPKILACESCDLKVEGDFHFNEFASLAPEDLYFLRVFVQSEGKVREMEAALGLTYPTIRTRITDLKNKIFAAAENATPKNEPKKETVKEILEKLERKEIPFEEAMKAIKKGRKK